MAQKTVNNQDVVVTELFYEIVIDSVELSIIPMQLANDNGGGTYDVDDWIADLDDFMKNTVAVNIAAGRTPTPATVVVRRYWAASGNLLVATPVVI